MPSSVQSWSETVTIPTYRAGNPDRNPMFLEKRVYQGSSGVVYPHPVIDRISDERTNERYTAVFLENRYLKIMILPEIGGRVQMALDKTNGYRFVYYNQVIKPALVGLSGPWISGGIEFNWPQHHRPSTFDPLDWRIDKNPDGSHTVWCSEIEGMFHTKGMHGFTLYPDRAYLEIRVQLYNRTSEPQTFLWWANPAVHVNDDYQSVFPPDVHAVMDHGKRDVSSFPIATGTYYKVNYGANGVGTDISRYKNIPVPTSYMAYHSDFDFVGDYDHGKRAGMLHIANHHVVPGKKQWTWGNSDFGKTWDRQLTDQDGPYIELMCGAYTDNQPDFSWIMPGEEKAFTQIFMPYQQIGPACNASKDVVLHLEVQENEEDEEAIVGVYSSMPREITVHLRRGNEVLFERTVMLSPEQPLLETISIPGRVPPQGLTLRALDASGRELLSFTPLPDEKPEIPSPLAPAKDPAEIATNEELFLNGQHLEQYRHATYIPEPYYEEALRRDPLDARCNNAMGLLLYRRGKFAEAEAYFRKAIQRLTLRNPNPYDGEPYYNLGLSLNMQGQFAEAKNAFYKAVWNAAWQGPAYFELARLASRAGQTEEALELVERALHNNWTNHRARHLKIALLRRQGRNREARQQIKAALELDRMEPGALFEKLLNSGHRDFERLISKAADPAHTAYTCAAVALDYAHAGMWNEALIALAQAPKSDPLNHYYAAWIYLHAGEPDKARAAFAEAAAMTCDTCFPNTVESVLALQAAMQHNPSDARAPYALGNFWYAHRRYAEAITCWEQAAALDPHFPTSFRNLGLAYFNKLGDSSRSRDAYETAFRLDPSDARVFFELDQLYKKTNLPPAERLARLEAHPALVDARDDLTIEHINLLLLAGRHADGLAILARRNFHPWEGGEGKVLAAYVNCLVEQAREYLSADQFEHAVDCLQRAQVYPPNLGEGKLFGTLENHIFYYLGLAYAGLDQSETAREYFTRATIGLSEPTSARYYNDQPPHMIFYQGLALRKLGREDEAQSVFTKLVLYGQQHLDDTVKMDYFAVSLPDFLVFDEDLNRGNRIHCHSMQALGALGLGDTAYALAQFNTVLSLNADHIGASLHKRLVAG
jgi:tetratricopeptide (TPR) repeat protein